MNKTIFKQVTVFFTSAPFMGVLLKDKQFVVCKQAFLSQVAHFYCELSVLPLQLFVLHERRLPFAILLIEFALRQAVSTAYEIVLFKGLDLRRLSCDFLLERFNVPLQIACIFFVLVPFLSQSHNLVAECAQHLLKIGFAATAAFDSSKQCFNVIVHVSCELDDLRLA